MVHKIPTRLIVTQLQDMDIVKGASIGGGDLVPNTNVALTDEALRMVRHTRLTLTDFVVLVTNSNEYGGTKLCDLPDSNMLLLGVEADLICTKDGTGIVTGELPEVALGTAIATNATLAGTMEDVLLGKALASGLTPPYVNHTNDQATPHLEFFDDSASGALFLNVAVDPTGDGSLTISGTFDFYYLDTGNVGS